MNLREVLTRIHGWIPPETAQPYDNVGLQVGDPEAPVTKALVALDMTPQVLDEAVETGSNLIVTHHPLLFDGLKRVDAGEFIGSLVHRLAANSINLVAAHTNLDAAQNGVSAKLAELLRIENPKFLKPLQSDLVKLVTYVPVDHAESVRTAITGATDQTIGPYRDVAFQSSGEGFFKPLEGANPFIGSPGGDIERVEEKRLEITLTSQNLAAAITALKTTHPYQTAAYDVFSMDLPSDEFGMGMIGDIANPVSLSSFLERICLALDLEVARYTGDPEALISRVAVCGGAGRDLIATAIEAGADAFVTADLSYHSFFEVLDTAGSPVMALIDAGHYETEYGSEALLAEWLRTNIPEIEWSRTQQRTSPVRYHINRSRDHSSDNSGPGSNS